MKVINTSPFSTDTPDSAMKPTAAEIDSGMSRSHSASTPPVNANGIPVNTSSPSFRLPNIANNSTKTRNKAAGTTSCKRFDADCRFSKVPPQLIQ